MRVCDITDVRDCHNIMSVFWVKAPRAGSLWRETNSPRLAPSAGVLSRSRLISALFQVLWGNILLISKSNLQTPSRWRGRTSRSSASRWESKKSDEFCCSQKHRFDHFSQTLHYSAQFSANISVFNHFSFKLHFVDRFNIIVQYLNKLLKVKMPLTDTDECWVSKITSVISLWFMNPLLTGNVLARFSQSFKQTLLQ